MTAAAGAVLAGHWAGIPIAVAGAVALSLGTWWQSRGVVDAVAGSAALGGRHLVSLVRRPVWLVGTGLLGAAIVLQLSALRLSPLTVVQPIGAVALVVTELTRLVVHGHRPRPRRVLAVVLCVGGIAAFVVLAARSVHEAPVTDAHLKTLLGLLAMVLTTVAAAFRLARRQPSAIACTVGAGVLYGFVATLAKTVLTRLAQQEFGWLSVAAVAGLLLATAVGAWLVQHAHVARRPELVVAGLTVVDPVVAVVLALTVLGEAGTASPVTVAGFLLTGATAAAGVVLLTTTPVPAPQDRTGS